MKEFAAQVPELRAPARAARGDLAGRRGARRAASLELPDQPTDAEIEAVEGQLSAEERAAVQAAFGWFQTNCA